MRVDDPPPFATRVDAQIQDRGRATVVLRVCVCLGIALVLARQALAVSADCLLRVGTAIVGPPSTPVFRARVHVQMS